MTLPPRRFRLAAAASVALLSLAALAQPGATDPPPPGNPAPLLKPAARAATPADEPAVKAPPQASALTAELFYEVLLGELTARSGDAGAGYALVLDAARRSSDPQLFQRAVEIALQARSGDSALEATQAWKTALPASRDARRFELQILIALNRLSETVEPLRAEVAATPLVERPLLMAVIARNYGRASDKKLAAAVVEQALVDELAHPETAALAWATVGRLRLNAGLPSAALDAALKGRDADPLAEGPVVLALDLIDPAQPLAEPIVKRYLQNPKARPELRMAYARVLLEARRYPEATAELTALTTAQPSLAEAWLLLGTLQSHARQDRAAQTSLQRYVALSQTPGNADERKRGLTQAYLLLAQVAERRQDFTAAEGWLAKVEDSDNLIAAQSRRAGLLARQGKLVEALALLRDLPERSPEDARQKLNAQVQLLREARQFQQAYNLLAQARTAAPDDSDLIYDQALLADRLQRFDEMERLLRRVIELKPDNPHAYNALGYSLADRKLRLEEARTLIQKALSLAPDDPFITDSLGWAEFRLGRAAEATRLLEGAYQKRPDPEIGAHLGEVLWSAGERERALKIWKEALLADADNETLQETLQRLRVKP